MNLCFWVAQPESICYTVCIIRKGRAIEFERAFGKTIFLTLEDANKAIQNKISIAEKRKLLKEYERELNEKFGLEGHFIIK